MVGAPKLLSKPVSLPKVNLASLKSKFSKGDRVVTNRQNQWLAPYVLLATVAPQLGLLWRPRLGAYATAASLVMLLALGLKAGNVRKLALSAAIIPTALLVSLTLPQQDAFARSAEFYDVVLLLALVYGRMFSISKSRSMLSLKKKYLVLLPLMVVIGQVLGAVGFGMLRGTYPYQGTPLALVASTAVVFAIAEELLFRGLIQQHASKVMRPVVAVVTASIADAVIFAVHGSVMPFAYAIVAGAVLGGIYYFKQNLLLTMTANIAMKLTFVGLMATFVLR